MMDPNPIVCSSWVSLDPQYKDRPLRWRCLWIAHVTRLRTGRQIRRGDKLGEFCTIRASCDSLSTSYEYAHRLYLEAGGEYVEYIPRRQRRRQA
jgi:hypothetical protein